MKLRLALLVIFSTAYFFSRAQQIQYGITAAVNMANVTGVGMSPKFQPGFEGGVYAAIQLDKDWSIQPELVYDFLKVGRVDNFSTFYVNGSRDGSKAAFNLGYLSIPILINYHISPKFSVNAGPQYSFLTYSNENLLYYNRAFKNNDFGIRGGFQFAPSPTVNIFASYYNGFANISDINNGDNNYKWTNKQIQIGLNIAVFTPGAKK